MSRGLEMMLPSAECSPGNLRILGSRAKFLFVFFGELRSSGIPLIPYGTDGLLVCEVLEG